MVKINISTNDKYDFGFKIDTLAKRIAKEVFDYEKVKYDTSFNLSVVSTTRIKKINKDYRNIDKVTDVLSFPNIDFKKPADFSRYVDKKSIDVSIIDLSSNTINLGDVVICYNKVLSQAKKYNHSVKREFSFLLTHSLLHLLGYDHELKKDEIIMFDKQEKILNKLKIVR